MNPFSLPLACLFLLAPIADGWLGVYLAPDREQAVVVEVIPDSPAASAGLQVGDELLAVGDRATPTRDDLIAAIRGHKAGEQLRLKIRRAGKESVVVVKLAERPEAVPAPGVVLPTPVPPKQGQPPRPAVETAPIAPVPPGGQKAFLGLRVRETDRGVVVDEALDGGPAQALGIKPGERITMLGDREVRLLSDLDAVLQRSAPGKKLAIGLQSAAGTRSLTITLGAAPGAATGRAQSSRAPVGPANAEPYDVEREIEALRRDLQDLRRQLEEMRRQKQKS